MPKFKKFISIIFSIVILVAVWAFFWVKGISEKGLPDYDANLTLKNMREEVIVYRDSLAVPHIIANNEEDLYRATGYCMAQDRLWQMDLIRRATSGRLSEIFGSSMINADQLLRALRIPEKSQKIIDVTEPELIQYLEAFSDGVNQFIDNHQKLMPPEFSILGYKPDLWEPEHSINLIGYMAWDLTMPWLIEATMHKILKKVGPELYQELLPDMDYQPTVAYPEFSAADLDDESLALVLASADLTNLGISAFDASNNWVISGIKNDSGLPLFANDMHMGLSAPGIWYQMHQIVRGKLNVTGIAVPGQPMVVAGHNEYIAWGMSNVMVDDMDFYEERLNPENPDEYLFNDEWLPLEIRREVIDVKDEESVERYNRFTHRGPIISDIKKLEETAVSMRWIGNEMSNELRTIYLLNNARNWREFQEAVRTFVAVSQNIAYADIHGNIGIYCCAGVPIRKDWDGIAIAPGWVDTYDWQGLIPFEELPHSFNPESGYVSSANNRSAGKKYPYHISAWYAPQYRIDRIRELLEEKEVLDIDDYKRIQADHSSKMVDRFLHKITQTLKTAELNDFENDAFLTIQNWDRVHTVNSIGATIFESFYNQLLKNIFQDELGSDLYSDYISVGYLPNNAVDKFWQDGHSGWFNNVNTEIVEDLETQIIISFQDGISYLADTLGNNIQSWEWGKLHQLEINHPLGSVNILNKAFKFNKKRIPVGGASHTVSPYAYSYNKPFNSDFGSSHRHIYSVADWNQSLSIIPTGISGIPASEHYCDQTELFVNNIYRKDYMSENLVRETARYVMTILPE
ncbi:penicillin acylase family protein [Candidatus Neomarinimicrobiota bacterium]